MADVRERTYKGVKIFLKPRGDSWEWKARKPNSTTIYKGCKSTITESLREARARIDKF